MSPMLLGEGALLVIELPPTRRQMTVAGGLASARQRKETESMFSSRSTVGVPTRVTSGASVEEKEMTPVNNNSENSSSFSCCRMRWEMIGMMRTYSGCRA